MAYESSDNLFHSCEIAKPRTGKFFDDCDGGS